MSSNNGCIKFHLNIEDPNIVFPDYFKKYLKHNGHYTSNVRIITADVSKPITIKLKKNVFFAMIALKGL